MNAIWRVLQDKGSTPQLANTETLVEHATGLLDLVRDTFPTYTLHNHVHAENVLALMEKLLGDHVEHLSALEAAMLILSAYYHDIGMVFTEAERDSIEADPYFDAYLRSHPAAYVAMRTATDPDESVLEGFCRWRHADRVTEFLNRADQKLLLWEGGVSLRQRLGEVCRSHNQDAEYLNKEFFDGEFLGSCDLRLCATLLRLADILDFDRSRSPDAVYEYLGIAKRSTPRAEQSDVEWLKHLNSGGFKFPSKRPPSYELTFVAGPDNPAVEKDVRDFLDVIEIEMASCQRLLQRCDDRWRSLTLPGKVSRKDIISNGYLFGDYRFSLDRTAVLELFMGEHLYTDPTVFLREILQNSIDAVRARAYLHGLDPVAEQLRVTVSEWRDADGYQWVRVDDDGTGMNLDIIRTYLMRIGKSYYSSADFAADAIRYGKGDPLVSISRFGVGLLSCFMLADRVELNTCRITAGKGFEEPIRITFHHLADFFTVQSKPEVPSPFPSRFGLEAGYRTRPGTSIAVRIDPRKHGALEDVRGMCDKFVLASPVPIYFHDDEIDDGTLTAPRRSWPKVSEDLQMRWSDELPALDELLAECEPVVMHIHPLDFSNGDPAAAVRGVGYLAIVDTTELRAALRSRGLRDLLVLTDEEWGHGAHPNNGQRWSSSARLRLTVRENYVGAPQIVLEINLLRSYVCSATPSYFSDDDDSQEQTAIRMALASRLSGLAVAGTRDVRLDGTGQDPSDPSGSALATESGWSHNGVRLPSDRTYSLPVREWLKFEVFNDEVSACGLVFGSFWLRDDLRPDLNIARDRLQAMSFRLRSALALSVERSMRECSRYDLNALSRQPEFLTAHMVEPGQRPTLREVLDDPLVTSATGWVREKLFKLDSGDAVSVDDITAAVRSATRPLLRFPRPFNQMDPALPWALLHAHTLFEVDAVTSRITIVGAKLPPQADALLLPFEPDAFCMYATPDHLFGRFRRSENWGFVAPINMRHPLAKWFLDVYALLDRQAPAMGKALLSLLRPDRPVDDRDALVAQVRSVCDQIGRALPEAGRYRYTGRLSVDDIFEVTLDETNPTS